MESGICKITVFEVIWKLSVRNSMIMLKQLFLLITASLLFANGCSKSEPKSEEPNDTSSTVQSQAAMSSTHYSAELFCYIGEIGSRANAHTIISDPNKETIPNLKETIPNLKMNSQSLSCGYPGKVSKISWKFIKHRDNADIYSFERIFPVDTNEQSMTSKVVEYKGRQTIVFQDEYHVVVLDSPK